LGTPVTRYIQAFALEPSPSSYSGPNPSVNGANFRFSIPRATSVTLSMIDSRGREVGARGALPSVNSGTAISNVPGLQMGVKPDRSRRVQIVGGLRNARGVMTG
jgi:hypothetical protein